MTFTTRSGAPYRISTSCKFSRHSSSSTSTFPSSSTQQGIDEYLILRHVLKTNFYQPTKVALSFRLAPDFLPEVEYPKKPYGVFFIIGNEFRGFHIRFRDVARGGIRIVNSRNREYVLLCVPPHISKPNDSLGTTPLTRDSCSMRTTGWLLRRP